jgi:hypothetical protein
MILKRRLYINSILNSVLEDYNKKIKKLSIEEEYPCECEEIRRTFKTRINSILYCSKYQELLLKIKEYNEMKALL